MFPCQAAHQNAGLHRSITFGGLGSPDGILDLVHATSQGIIAGARMVLVDFHPHPEAALVDGPQALLLLAPLSGRCATNASCSRKSIWNNYDHIVGHRAPGLKRPKTTAHGGFRFALSVCQGPSPQCRRHSHDHDGAARTCSQPLLVEQTTAAALTQLNATAAHPNWETVSRCQL